jgi:hypothetical protein
MDSFNLKYLKAHGAAAFIVLVGIGLYLTNEYLSTYYLISIPVIGFVPKIMHLMNIHLWNIWPFKFLYTVPDFSGIYEGELIYQYQNDAGEKITGRLPHRKEIVQNGNDIIIHSITQKSNGEESSKSTSLHAQIIKKPDGKYKVLFNYLNNGNGFEDFNPHYGTEVLDFELTKAEKIISGKYYTERSPFQTRGTTKLICKKNKK